MIKRKKNHLITFSIILITLLILAFISFKYSGLVTLKWVNLSNFNPLNIFLRFIRPTTTATTVPTSLINDKNYLQNEINSFLKNNPTANENYARDVIYRNVARKEKKLSICEKINNEDIKKSCYNAVI